MPPKKRGTKRAREEIPENNHHNDDDDLPKMEDTIADDHKTDDDKDMNDDDDLPFGGNNFKMNKDTRKGTACPYLDTISRQNLDFDFEKCCSVSLTHVNVYVCLVCGKYFQGRGPNTHAYTHSLETQHHVFMKLDTGRCYCLPDMYEIMDRSLQDIQYVLNPTYTQVEVAATEKNALWSRSLDGTEYMPGLVGLNNMKHNDYANAIFQLLNCICPLRNFFLIAENYKHVTTPLAVRFGELIRKMWNPRAFKGQVSPHEILQSVMNASNKRFLIEKQSDPVDFYSWIVNALHAELTLGKRKKPSVVTAALQGELEVTTLAGTGKARESLQDITERLPFMLLTLDLPPAPLFKDAFDKVMIPQIPLFDLLKKFDGTSVHDDVTAGRRAMRLTRLPKYLLLHIKRFSKNQFFMEKNPTIVNFPMKGLDLSSCIPIPRNEQGKAVNAKYDLVANIAHEGKAGEGTYKIHVHRQSEGLWFEVQDLVLTEVLPQVVVLSEAYVLLYCLQEGEKEG